MQYNTVSIHLVCSILERRRSIDSKDEFHCEKLESWVTTTSHICCLSNDRGKVTSACFTSEFSNNTALCYFQLKTIQ